MNIDALRTLVAKRRSIRGYDESREISDGAIQTILDVARWAPSGGNGQPWEFIVVRDPATRYKIADYYMKQMDQKRRNGSRRAWHGEDDRRRLSPRTGAHRYSRRP
jgi:nitroreductase